MTVEEILRPRYKVIADYPMSKMYFNIGDVLYWNQQHDSYRIDDKKVSMAKETVESYPHLFKRLEWWEERKPEDMPEYVKCIKTPDNFHFPEQFYRVHYANGICYSNIQMAVIFETNCYLPATLQEFNEYLTKTKQQ